MKTINFIKTLLSKILKNKTDIKNNPVIDSDLEKLKAVLLINDKHKAIAEELNSNEVFQKFKTEIIEKYIEQKINTICNTSDKDIVFENSKRLAGILDIFNILDIAVNTDTTKIMNDYLKNQNNDIFNIEERNQHIQNLIEDYKKQK